MRSFSIFMVVILILSMVCFGQAAENRTNKAILFTLHGLSNLGTGNYNGGVGGKVFFTDFLAVRGSVGAEYSRTENGSMLSNNITGGLMFNWSSTSNTAAYFGGEVQYAHNGSTSTDSYGLAGFIGAEIFVWQNVSLSPEYRILIDRNPSGDITSVRLGQDAADFTLSVYF